MALKDLGWARKSVGIMLSVGLLIVSGQLGRWLLSSHPVRLCPFYLLTGYDCPFCGLTRGMILGLNGQWESAFHLHPFWWLFVLVLGIVIFGELMARLGEPRWRQNNRRWSGRVSVGLVAFTIMIYLFRFF